MSTASIDRFQQLLRIPTVSRTVESDTDWAPFGVFVESLQRLYPALHAATTREIVAEHSLLFRWAGKVAESPTVLMAHYDVVPVIEDEWTHPPFAAEIMGAGADAVIHARGAIDDKGALVAILEAVEALAAEGYTPAHDIYLSFGHNEETTGEGARAIVQLLKERGIRPGLVLDEGGAIVDNVLPGVDAPTAVVGVTERGTMNLVLTATEAGGHASTPPLMPATARLARAIDRLHRHPFPTRITPPIRAMFTTMAPRINGPLGWVLGNVTLTGPVLAKLLPRLGAEMNATVRTTAVVTQLSGAPGDNVLATSATATVNIRLLPGDTIESATEHVRAAVKDPEIAITVKHGSNPSPISPWKGATWQRIPAAVSAGISRDVVTTPYMQLGASDSRWFTEISDHVYRFTPFLITADEREALHSHNERIHVESWLRGIRFYRELIRAS